MTTRPTQTAALFFKPSRRNVDHIEFDDYIETRWCSSGLTDVAIALFNAKVDPLAVDNEGPTTLTTLHLLCLLQEEFDEASCDVLAALTCHCPAAIFSAFLLHESTRTTLSLLAPS
ncbi:hypothetical protein P885DRAFT_56931 [Corynascus similis CBS 632.67]